MKGDTDSALSAVGIEQAELTGKWLAASPIDLVLTSPLKRARETAQLIASNLRRKSPSLEVREVPELKEIALGVFTGLTREEAAILFPADYAAFALKSFEGVSGAEKIVNLKERATKVWRLLQEEVKQGLHHIICVTHKGFLQWLLRLPFGFYEWMPLFEVDYCGIYRLRFANSTKGYYATWDLLNFTPWH